MRIRALLAMAALALVGCDEPPAPPALEALPHPDSGPVALIPAALLDGGPPDAGLDFRAQRIHNLNSHSPDYSPAELAEMVRNRRSRTSRWNALAGEPHSPATIAALKKVFLDSRDEEIRAEVLRALSEDHRPEVEALFAEFETQPREAWIPALVAAHPGAGGDAWRSAHAGQGAAWDTALVTAYRDHGVLFDLSDEALGQIFRDADDPADTRAEALGLLTQRTTHDCSEAIQSSVPELRVAALESDCELTRAVLEGALQSRGPVHVAAAMRAIHRGLPGAGDAAQAQLMVQLASDADPSVRWDALAWWKDSLKAPDPSSERPVAAAAAARRVLTRAVDDPTSSASKAALLQYDVAVAAELDGEFAGALERYRRLLALPADRLDSNQNQYQNLPAQAHLRMARIFLAEGGSKEMEAALRAMERSDPDENIGDDVEPYAGNPKEVAARFREDASFPLQLSASLSKDRRKVKLRMTNRGAQPLELGLVASRTDDGPKVVVPARTWVGASGAYLVGDMFDGQPERVTLAHGRSFDVDLPLPHGKVPRQFELSAEVAVGLPQGMGHPESDGRVVLRTIAAVR